MRFWCMIHKLQTMNFTNAKMVVITICLVMDFTHGCVSRILLAQVHSTEPDRFHSQRFQPGDVATHPYSVGNRVRQTPLVWHTIIVRIN